MQMVSLPISFICKLVKGKLNTDVFRHFIIGKKVASIYEVLKSLEWLDNLLFT